MAGAPRSGEKQCPGRRPSSESVRRKAPDSLAGRRKAVPHFDDSSGGPGWQIQLLPYRRLAALSRIRSGLVRDGDEHAAQLTNTRPSSPAYIRAARITRRLGRPFLRLKGELHVAPLAPDDLDAVPL